MIDRSKLISLLSSTKPQDLLVLSVNSLDKNSYKNYKIEIDKFFSEDGGLRSLAERKHSNLISVNSNESKVNLIQECKR